MLVTVGCESDKTINPVAPSEYQIVMEELPDSLVWLAGSEMTLPVTAIVLDSEGNLASGVRVDFTIQSGGGLFDSSTVTSDAHGRVSANATITVRDGWQEFKPMLLVSGGTAEGAVNLRGIREPSRINFVAPTTVRLQNLLDRF